MLEDSRDQELTALRSQYRSMEERFRILHDRTSQGVLIYSAEGRLISRNPAAGRILDLDGEGFSALDRWPLAESKPIGAKLEVLRLDGTPLPVEEFPPFVALKTGAEVCETLLGFRRPEADEPRWVRMSAVPRSGAARPEEVISFLDDLSELRDAHQAVRASEQQLVVEQARLSRQLAHGQRMEAMGALAGRVAHDFNNLMMTVAGYTQLLLSEVSRDSSMREDLVEIDNAAARATELARDLLALRRLKPQKAESTDFGEVLRSIRPLLERTLGDHIELRLEAAEGTIITADSNQITAVLLNLAENSRDAMPVGGTLSISARSVRAESAGDAKRGASSYVLIEVKDTGAGIPESIQGRIFEPFFTTKAEDKGSGLGLVAVEEVVKQNSGWVDAVSEEGAGTTIFIYLPAESG